MFSRAQVELQEVSLVHFLIKICPFQSVLTLCKSHSIIYIVFPVSDEPKILKKHLAC